MKERAHRHVTERERMSGMLCAYASVFVGVCLYVRLRGHTKIDSRYNNNSFNKAPCDASSRLIFTVNSQ